MCYRIEGDAKRIRLIANKPEKIEFSVEFATNEGGSCLIQDMGENLEFEIPAREGVSVRVSLSVDGDEDIQTKEIVLG